MELKTKFLTRKVVKDAIEDILAGPPSPHREEGIICHFTCLLGIFEPD